MCCTVNVRAGWPLAMFGFLLGANRTDWSCTNFLRDTRKSLLVVAVLVDVFEESRAALVTGRDRDKTSRIAIEIAEEKLMFVNVIVNVDFQFNSVGSSCSSIDNSSSLSSVEVILLISLATVSAWQ